MKRFIGLLNVLLLFTTVAAFAQQKQSGEVRPLEIPRVEKGEHVNPYGLFLFV